jgi:L-ascorbate metabolism protein UlaG (beta-lactamase superfamily)
MSPPEPRRYANRSGVEIDGAGVGRWMLQRARDRLPKAPQQQVVGVRPDLAFLHANRTAPALTWIGHSSLLYQIDGVNVLVDPVFSRRASPVPFAGPKRHQPPGVRAHELPRIDVVLLSHNHYDHLDRASMRAVARQAGGPPVFVVPRGTESWFARHLPSRGGRAAVTACDWDDVVRWPGRTGEIALHFLSVQHWSNRTLFNRNHSLWGSWAILHPDFRFWFSGDLGYSDEPRAIGARFGPFDAAAIAIGAYEPRWFMRAQHVNPDEAVQVMLDVGAREAIGVHWGTFALTDEPLDQPPRDLAAALTTRGIPAERFRVLRHGETRRYPWPGTPAVADTP